MIGDCAFNRQSPIAKSPFAKSSIEESSIGDPIANQQSFDHQSSIGNSIANRQSAVGSPLTSPARV
jgi:hypothetical protein